MTKLTSALASRVTAAAKAPAPTPRRTIPPMAAAISGMTYDFPGESLASR